MPENKIQSIVAFLFIVSTAGSGAVVQANEPPGTTSGRVTLVSKSSGLGTPSMEEGCTELELGDVDRDGNLDIVSVGDHGSPNFNSDEHGIMVWLGDGGRTWSVHQTGNFGYGGCALGDLDRDGQCDIAWGIHHNYGVAGFGDTLMGAALGDGTGCGWTPWGTGLASNGETWGMFATAMADFDGDGLLDVVSESFGGSNGLRLYRNLGNGSWTQAWALTGGSVGYTIETCDFDGDGYADIVSTYAGSNALRGNGQFGFASAMGGLPAGTIRGIDAGDMNGDGREDLVFALGSSGVRCFSFDTGSSTWGSASAGLPATGTYYRCQFGDFDGDGCADIVTFSDPQGFVYLGDGNGNWTADASWTMPAPGDAAALRVDGDADHDGRDDIAVLATKSDFPVNRNQLRLYSPWQEPQALQARVLCPRGGETLRKGSIREIRWAAAVPPAQGAAKVSLRVSEYGPAGPWTSIASDLPDNGRYEWQVDGYSSPRCCVEVRVTTTQESVVALSAEDFSIVDGTEPLACDPQTLSAGTGGKVLFFMDAGPAHAQRFHLLLGSASGTSPGFPLPGGMTVLPLNLDVFTWYWVIPFLNTSLFLSFYGTLKEQGIDSAQMNAPPLPPECVGVKLYFAFCLCYPYDFASNPVTIEVVQ